MTLQEMLHQYEPVDVGKVGLAVGVIWGMLIGGLVGWLIGRRGR